MIKVELKYEEISNELAVKIGMLEKDLVIERIKNSKLQDEILRKEEEIKKLKQDAAE
jgi:hypothetical protein